MDTPLDLRPHQQKAHDDLLVALRTHERATAELACGTGKTLLGLRVAESTGARLVVVFLPSIALVAQTLMEWRANAAAPRRWLAVCSDRTTAATDDIRAGELPTMVTTDPEVVAGIAARADRPLVVFATYQSSDVIARSGVRWDLMLCDEAHRTTGSLTGPFAAVLDDVNIFADRRVFMTATPRVLRDTSLASMDDPALYGPTAHRFPFSKAIAQDLLCDYRVVVVGVNDSEIHACMMNEGSVTVDGAKVSAHEAAAQVALLKTMQRFGLSRVLTYHSSVARAVSFAATLPDMAKLTGLPVPVAEAVSGATPVQRRRQVLKRLAGGSTQVVSNARCLTEGVNIPAVEAVAVVDPKRSKIDIVQVVGRAIRRHSKKTFGYVILPVYVPEGANADTVMQAGSFDAIWAVLRTLRSNDDLLAAGLDAARDAVAAGRPPRMPDKVILDLPAHLPADFHEALAVRLIETATDPWPVMYKRYRDAGVATGDAVLRRWANYQRTRYRKGWLRDEEITLLEAVDGWSWEVAQGKRIPDALRDRMREMRASGLTWPQIAETLNSEGTFTPSGVPWLQSGVRGAVDGAKPATSREQRWLSKFERLQEWTVWVGPLQRRNDGMEPDLSAFMTEQRLRYHGRARSPLAPARAALMETLPGWTWELASAKRASA